MQQTVLTQYGTPASFATRTVDVPAPAPGTVRVRVHAAGLNPLDAKIARGEMADAMPMPLPAPVASDFAGVIDALPDDVATEAGLAVGDAVFGMASGVLADYLIVTADAVTRRPDNVPVDTAAVSAMVGLSAATILDHLNPSPPDATALVIGASGGIGRFLLPALHTRGYRITATGTADDVDRLRAAGADTVLDYHANDLAAHTREHHADGYHLVIDMINQLGPILDTAQLVRAGGQLVSTLFGPDPDRFSDQITVTYIRNSPSAQGLAQVAAMLAGNPDLMHVDHHIDAAGTLDALTDYSTGRLHGKVAITVNP